MFFLCIHSLFCIRCEIYNSAHVTTGIIEAAHIEWPQLYGGIYRIFIGSTCNVLLSSPELIEVGSFKDNPQTEIV